VRALLLCVFVLAMRPYSTFCFKKAQGGYKHKHSAKCKSTHKTEPSNYEAAHADRFSCCPVAPAPEAKAKNNKQEKPNPCLTCVRKLHQLCPYLG
jgi:hypothetical protein